MITKTGAKITKLLAIGATIKHIIDYLKCFTLNF